MKIIEYISYLMIPLIILSVVLFGERKKVSTYDYFIEGAKEGFSVISKIFPTMLAVVVAINLFKVSGAMDLFINIIRPIISVFKIPAEVLPIGIMRSISGGGALAILSDVLSSNGPDSLVGKIASTIMGASDTTLYVLAIYTATVGIKKTKEALWIGLFCDLIAFLMAVTIWNVII
jgi:spore maturation protein B